MEKLITYTLHGPTGFVVGTDPSSLVQMVLGDKETADEMFDDLKEGEFVEYKIIVEKKHTQEELDAMPESDGDIN